MLGVLSVVEKQKFSAVCVFSGIVLNVMNERMILFGVNS